MNNDTLMAALSPNLNTGEFAAWPKTPRVGKSPAGVVVTEKMDGTNACIVIENGEIVGIQSRNRFIAPGDDNFGFAKWVAEHADELIKLGNGTHYGEWVGPGIQNNPHNLTEKALYLFNVARPAHTLPECVRQVRVLYEGNVRDGLVDELMSDLRTHGDLNEYTPEGIIIYCRKTQTREKATFAHSNGKWCS